MKYMLVGLGLLLSIDVSAQKQMVSDTSAVYTINGIVNEVLKIVSGEEGKVRDWEAFRNLFLPTARLTVLYHTGSIPLPFETVTVEEFIELMDDAYYEKGFLEYETGKVVEEYNGVAHVFQSYYGKDSDNYEERGINSYQLIYSENRWWIVNMLWTGDSNGVKVPEKYVEK